MLLHDSEDVHVLSELHYFPDASQLGYGFVSYHLKLGEKCYIKSVPYLNMKLSIIMLF